ncbi:MAG TPA: hypothetical protein VGQ54_05995 [Burkholderiales bacterium]|nr:hypothetical protein [Burkholderiales bacterium]
MLNVVGKVSGALFGRSVHPMAEIKLAKKLIAELPVYDSALTLEEIGFWLESASRAEWFTLAYRFELLGLLDQAAKGHQRKITHEYLANDRREKVRANKLWTTIFESWKMLGSAYIRCIDQFQSDAGDAATNAKYLPVIVARALRALTMQLKWILQRYGAVDDRLWDDLGRIYQFAETRDIATVVVKIYPGVQGRSTVQREFLKAMMLSASSTHGLTPIAQEIAERTVAQLADMYVMQPQPVSGSNHCFDLWTRRKPARIFKGIESTPTMRFFGPGAALPALEQLIQKIKTGDRAPSHFDIGVSFEPDLVLPVMQHLALYWSDNPPARGSERRKIAARITVVRTFTQMLTNILSAADDDSLDFMPLDGSESWIIENVSDGGFGAIIPPLKGDWVRIGRVLGVQTETSQHWGVGVVRRITRANLQQRSVGIQLLSNTAIAVKLLPSGDHPASNPTQKGYPAVMLSTAPNPNGEIDLLLRARSFIPDQRFDLDVNGKQYHLMPSKLVEVGDNFDLARFKVV